MDSPKHGRTRLPAATLLVAGFVGAGCASRSALLDAVPAEDDATGASTSTSSSGTTTATTSGTTSSTSSEPSSGGTGGGGSGGAGGAAGDLLLSLSADSEYETTTDLRVGANGFVAVVWTAHPKYKNFRIGYTFSNDHGLSFAPPSFIECPKNLSADEPSIAITPQNEVFLSWVGSDSWGGKAIYVARAAPGATTFDSPTAAIEIKGYIDLQWPRIGVTANGTRIVAYMRSNVESVAASSADGVTWSQAPLPANPLVGEGVLVPDPCTTTSGAPPEPFTMVHAASGGVGLLITSDEGLTWTAAAGYPYGMGVPRCVLSGQKVFLGGGKGGVLRLLTDGPEGPSTWLLDKDIFQYSFFFRDVNMAVDAAGRFHMAYYVSSNDYLNAKGFRTLMVSPGAENLVTTTYAVPALTIETTEDSPAFIGWHVGVAVDGDMLLTSYADNSSGVSHIAFHRQPMP